MYNTITLELVLSGKMDDDGLYYLDDETIGPSFEKIVKDLIKRKKNKTIKRVTFNEDEKIYYDQNTTIEE
jgi:biopolymer transport protein ExbD